ncbi:phage tail protein [Myxococcus sp. CA051A]|uniref:Phage tail protein n=1 Tax=Myxococcus llanfairpwllgwyngyllgogerychwyrndrobwllllantysiliogogogochensis TaxID=2590453 RepID=A0A540WYH0_9BACT|nr:MULTISPECIES: phage tail protein [Myxococcus]NTX59565.1 phage tail protein [Myxococcus sp. CA051A]TQF14046.1 phage tail protein [Myxococcus llanfairpwllgwyngyllgogerychwyrndrobwllllantysiliogogogochensis]
MSLKERLKNAKRKVIKTVSLGEETVTLCRPTHTERIAVMSAARAAGEIGEDEKPIGVGGALRSIARMAAAVIYNPEATERVFDPTDNADVDAVCSAPWAEDIAKDVAQAFTPSFEEVKGNS